MDNILEVRGLKMHFGGVKAVDELSFDVHRHELLGVIGPNGSGKTTMFNALTGVYKPTDENYDVLSGENIGNGSGKRTGGRLAERYSE